MRRCVVVAAGLVAVLAAAVHAGPPVAGPPVAPCRVEPVTLSPGTESGVIRGGPAAGDGTLTCTVQVAPTHGGADVVVRSATGTGIVVVAPTAESYAIPPGAVTYVCTAWTPADGSPTVYYHPIDNGTANDVTDDVVPHWSDDSSTPCSPTAPPLLEPVRALAQDLKTGLIDAPLCAALVAAFADSTLGPLYVAPDGDVWLAGERLYDCPPYDNWPDEVRRGGDPARAEPAVSVSTPGVGRHCKLGARELGMRSRTSGVAGHPKVCRPATALGVPDSR